MLFRKMKQLVNHSFDACFEPDSEILILGSIPSVKSREEGFYYMHPKNRFWSVLSQVYAEEFPKTLEDKKALLEKYKIALWDVIQSCQINGSSDSSISNVIPNDIASILKKTNIQTIYTTGKKAFALYQKYIFPITGIEAIYLPSTSPANAILTEKDLVKQYQIIRSIVRSIVK